MTNPTLERAAMALCAEHGDVWQYVGVSEEERYRREARAVLMAVRIPSDETGGPVDVGYETMRHREVTTHKDARVCFTAMIDALLERSE